MLHKVNYLKAQLSEATALQKSGLISNIERVFIHMQIFKALANTYFDANIVAFFTKEYNNLKQVLKNEAPEILTA